MGSAQSTSCEKLSDSCAVKIGGTPDVDPILKDLRNETITVLETGHYRERCNNGSGIILHDFVGFGVRFEDGGPFRIKAEKCDSGIFVTLPTCSETRPLCWDKDVEMKYGCKNLEDCGKIRIEDLLAILEEPSPDYNLMSDNCWRYADATFKQVIRKFSETPSLSPERRSYLASFLDNAPPVMPDKVLGSVKSIVGTGVKVEVPLSTFIGVGVVIGAAAGAALVAAPTLATQVATFYKNLRLAGIPITPADVQNGLNAYTAAQAHGPQLLHDVHAMNPLVPVHHVPLIPGGGYTTLATQAVHAPLITHSFLHLVSSKAFIIATSIMKGAVRVAPFLWPVAVAVAGLVTVCVLYKVGTLGMDGTSWGQNIKKRLRSLFSRRRIKEGTGPPIDVIIS